MEEPEITNVKIRFAQEGNTLGTTSDFEELEISLEFKLSEKDGAFVVIKTEGWSLDDVSGLQKLVDKAKRVLD